MQALPSPESPQKLRVLPMRHSCWRLTGITWVALAGRVLFAIVAAVVLRWRDGQAQAMPPMA